VSAAAPKWVGSETVRATTSDGEVVKARVAIDADAASTRSVLENNRRDVALLMQISIASQDRTALRGAEGMKHLSDDMRNRLNTFLASHQVPAVKRVVVQDLLISQP
jgi:flagellar basal body-associated protein FliL